jgi:hypothetical protein
MIEQFRLASTSDEEHLLAYPDVYCSDDDEEWRHSQLLSALLSMPSFLWRLSEAYFSPNYQHWLWWWLAKCNNISMPS